MKHSFVAALAFAGSLAGCTFSGPSGGSGGDDDDVRTFVDDTAEDFADPSVLVGAALHARGAIDPETYAVGGLHMTAYARAILQPANSVTWAELEALVQITPATGSRQAVSPDSEFGGFQPFGVGLGVFDNFTLVFRGEIYLDAPTTFTLESDGPSLVQIDTDGTYGHQLYDQIGFPTSTLTVTPSGPGWYPIRAALTDTAGDAFIRLRTTAGVLPRTSFRSRTTAATGLVLEGFDDPMLTTPAGLGIETQDLMRDFGTSEPTWDFRLTSSDYGARMRGQVLVETPGRYRFGATPDADDHVRIWLDGKVISSRWGPGDTYDESAPLDLAAGWHDLTVDLGGVGATSAFAIELLEAPPGVATGVVPSKWLRPVVRFGQLDSRMLSGLSPINDNTQTEIPFPPAPLGVPFDAIVQAVDVGFDLDHTAPIQATVKLVHPDGTVDVLRTNDPADRAFEYHGARTAFEGKRVTGGPVPWKLVIDDNAPSAAGNIGSIMVAIGYRGGLAPVTSGALFESKPRPLPAEAAEIVAVRTVPAVPAGATIAISIRTCRTAEACASAEWQPVTGELSIPAEPFVEYRLELGSDGWAVPGVERVEIDYRIE